MLVAAICAVAKSVELAEVGVGLSGVAQMTGTPAIGSVRRSGFVPAVPHMDLIEEVIPCAATKRSTRPDGGRKSRECGLPSPCRTGGSRRTTSR